MSIETTLTLLVAASILVGAVIIRTIVMGVVKGAVFAARSVGVMEAKKPAVAATERKARARHKARTPHRVRHGVAGVAGYVSTEVAVGAREVSRQTGSLVQFTAAQVAYGWTKLVERWLRPAYLRTRDTAIPVYERTTDTILDSVKVIGGRETSGPIVLDPVEVVDTRPFSSGSRSSRS